VSLDQLHHVHSVSLRVGRSKQEDVTGYIFLLPQPLGHRSPFLKQARQAAAHTHAFRLPKADPSLPEVRVVCGCVCFVVGVVYRTVCVGGCFSPPRCAS
jgi:hypothetical protein